MVDERQTRYRAKGEGERSNLLRGSNLLYGEARHNRFRKGRQPFNLTEYDLGKVAEWSNAADSKSVVLLVGTGSSNLPLSAKSNSPPFGGLYFIASPLNKTSI